MPETNCGRPTSQLLALQGPTLLVDIGFDPNWKIGQGIPQSGIKGVSGLVDTGATECCIDNLFAASLKLPIVNRRQIAGIGGKQMANVYLAQVYITALNWTVYGAFAGVDLMAGGQVHSALLGRTFLQAFKMVYDGQTGAVVISR